MSWGFEAHLSNIGSENRQEGGEVERKVVALSLEFSRRGHIFRGARPSKISAEKVNSAAIKHPRVSIGPGNVRCQLWGSLNAPLNTFLERQKLFVSRKFPTFTLTSIPVLPPWILKEGLLGQIVNAKWERAPFLGAPPSHCRVGRLQCHKPPLSLPLKQTLDREWGNSSEF